MKFTKIDTTISHRLHELVKSNSPLDLVIQAVAQAGGRSLLVGGAVRDLLLGRDVKDLDIEVHGLALEKLEQVLRQFGPASEVGKAFGVLRLHGLDVDWALPRTDSAGRKPKVEINPHMDIKDAFRRRDLTINAMGIDLMTHELIDPFNGKEDLKKGILRSPYTALFIEDPLRFYRVMQFIGRFNMQPDAALNAVCATMDISSVSIERKELEFEKLLLKSQRPSLGFRWLQNIKRLKEVLPELYATVGIEQDPHWHPEGDVFEHTMQAIDGAALLTCDDSATKLILMYAAVCHDLGKVITTQEHNNGKISSHGHDVEGVALARSLLKRITTKKDLICAVEKLVRYHMAPVQFVVDGAKPPAYKRLALKLAPQVTMQMLADLALVDKRGRNPHGSDPLHTTIPDIEQFRRKAAEVKVLYEPEPPLLLGRDLMDVAQPGEQMGQMLKKAYEIQLEEGIRDKNELKKRVLK